MMRGVLAVAPLAACKAASNSARRLTVPRLRVSGRGTGGTGRTRTPYHATVHDEDPDRDRDNTLIVRVAAGDSDAFAEFYDRWSGRLFALIVRILL